MERMVDCNFFSLGQIFRKKAFTIVLREHFHIWKRYVCGTCVFCELVDVGKLTVIPVAHFFSLHNRYLVVKIRLLHLDLVTDGQVVLGRPTKIKRITQFAIHATVAKMRKIVMPIF